MKARLGWIALFVAAGAFVPAAIHWASAEARFERAFARALGGKQSHLYRQWGSRKSARLCFVPRDRMVQCVAPDVMPTRWSCGFNAPDEQHKDLSKAGGELSCARIVAWVETVNRDEAQSLKLEHVATMKAQWEECKREAEPEQRDLCLEFLRRLDAAEMKARREDCKRAAEPKERDLCLQYLRMVFGPTSDEPALTPSKPQR